jgi:hypothetical protein
LKGDVLDKRNAAFVQGEDTKILPKNQHFPMNEIEKIAVKNAISTMFHVEQFTFPHYAWKTR